MKYWYKACLTNRKWIMDKKDKTYNMILAWSILTSI